MKTENSSICSFECDKDCSEWCCSGATLVTIDEIRKCYDIFQITVGFRKYLPADNEHRSFLDAIGSREGDRYIVGDFIAGNWRKKRCPALDSDNFCKLHREGKKPLQCRVVPFCAIFPENRQDAVFAEQKQGKFARCKGYKPTDNKDCVVWQDGKFTDSVYRDSFHGYQQALIKQKPFMQKILAILKDQQTYGEFLKGEGILETFIPMSILFDILEASGICDNECFSFLKKQNRLCCNELASGAAENQVFEDYLNMINTIAEMYAKFIGNKKAGQN